jgi:uncharacterized protein YgbK (DUF1537 family)
MQAQTKRKVGLIDYKTVARGAAAIAQRIAQLKFEGVGIAIVDAISNEDLMRLGPALKDMPLVTAGSGVAIGLPQNFGIAPSENSSVLPVAAGYQAIVSGSCSVATNAQVKAFIASGLPALAIDPLQAASGADVVQVALDWAKPLLPKSPVLVYSTASPEAIAKVQSQLGVEAAGALVERSLAAIAKGLVQAGVRQLVVAGGETSGACVQALGITQMQIGMQIAPGVPWCYAEGRMEGQSMPLHITLKSGNFGAPDFFTQSFKGLA